jgi:tetratricopeptide (TPR) repeat protein
MIVRGVVLPILAIALAFAAHGQHDRLSDRHTRIHDLYGQERYAEMIRETDAQLNEVEGTPYQDSLHHYLYKYGRAQWKTHGAEAGVAAAERLWSIIDRLDRDPRHRILALGDLSWIYYELGRLRECVRVDSLALNIAERHTSAIPSSMLGKAYHYLGYDHDALGDHARALHYFQAALRTYEGSDAPIASQAETHTGIGVSYWRMGRTRDAQHHYREALELLAADSSSAGLVRKAGAYGNMGILWQDAGDLAQSKAYYQRSIDLGSRIIATTKDPFQRDEAIFVRAKGYLNLATVYHISGDRKRARELLERSMKDRLTVLQPDDPQVLRVHERFADLEAAAQEYDKAEQLLRMYIKGCEDRYGRRTP